MGDLHRSRSRSCRVKYIITNATVNEPTIAELFVRINGKGKALNQADFIVTLMSVFWEQGRVALEAFSHKNYAA